MVFGHAIALLALATYAYSPYHKILTFFTSKFFYYLLQASNLLTLLEQIFTYCQNYGNKVTVNARYNLISSAFEGRTNYKL